VLWCKQRCSDGIFSDHTSKEVIMSYIIVAITGIRDAALNNRFRDGFEAMLKPMLEPRRRRQREMRCAEKLELRRKSDSVFAHAKEGCINDLQRSTLACVRAYYENEPYPKTYDTHRIREFLERVGITRSTFPELFELLFPA